MDSRDKNQLNLFFAMSLTYPDATQPTLNQLQLELDMAAHAKMLITGPSGGGKSTLLRLMLGLLVPQAGTIQFEDTDKRDLAASANSMSFVPQVVALFEDTLANNVTLGRQVSDRQLTLVLHQVGLTDFIARLPQGLATLVHGQDGVNVSAGNCKKSGLPALCWLSGRCYFWMNRSQILMRPRHRHLASSCGSCRWR